MAPSTEQHDTVTVTINGTLYTAQRRISGTVNLRQILTFMGHKEADGQVYRAAERAKMDAMAVFILQQLVTRGWPGQPRMEPGSREDPPSTNRR